MSETKPRLIFVNRVYWPSTEATAQLLTDLAENLVRRGWSVQVIAAGTESATHGGVTIHRTGLGATNGGLLSRISNYVRYIWQTRRLIRTVVRKGDQVIVMTDPPMLGALVTGVARRQEARVIHWIQDIYPEILVAHLGPWSAIFLWPLRIFRNQSWHAAATCITLGDDMAKVLNANRVPIEKIAVIPNWAPHELDQIPESAVVTAKRAQWKLSEKFIVGYSGNLGRVHEFRTIIDAAERLIDQPVVAFVFIGGGAQLNAIREAVREKRLANVHFFPAAPRNELAASLAAADAHLVTLKPRFAPYVYPSKLAGVLAAGRPVLFVGSLTGEIAGALIDTRSGMSIEISDASQLATVITTWASNPSLAREAGQRARIAYENKYSLDASLELWTHALNCTKHKTRSSVALNAE